MYGEVIAIFRSTRKTWEYTRWTERKHLLVLIFVVHLVTIMLEMVKS
jgi:hypothetical protein